VISRKTARLLGEAYSVVFAAITTGTAASGRRYREFRLHNDELHDFLFDEGYEPWLLTILNSTNVSSERIIKERIMNFHTGETFTWFPSPPQNGTPEDRAAAGQGILRRLAESLLRMAQQLGSRPRLVYVAIDSLRSHLELDGYIFRNDTLYAAESSVVNEQEEQTYLELLISGSALADLPLIQHHLELSENAYTESRWNDTISNARNFLESILDQVANALAQRLTGAIRSESVSNPAQVRDYLENNGFIDATEKSAIARVYGLISNTGSHPNMAHKDQARLMRNLALTFSQYILLRWEGYRQNNP
jgi:hypothetical protein